MLIEVFEVEKSRIRWYYIIAYCLPLSIVFISGAIFPQGYGNERYCWLRPDKYFIYSFVGPVILVIIVSNNKLIRIINQRFITGSFFLEKKRKGRNGKTSPFLNKLNEICIFTLYIYENLEITEQIHSVGTQSRN